MLFSDLNYRSASPSNGCFMYFKETKIGGPAQRCSITDYNRDFERLLSLLKGPAPWLPEENRDRDPFHNETNRTHCLVWVSLTWHEAQAQNHVAQRHAAADIYCFLNRLQFRLQIQESQAGISFGVQLGQRADFEDLR